MKLLSFLQLENDGKFSPSMFVFYTSFLVSMFCTIRGCPVNIALLALFGVGAVGQTLAGAVEFFTQRQLAEHGHQEAVEKLKADAVVDSTKVHTDAADLKDKMEKLAEQVALLASPERKAALKVMAEQGQIPKHKIDRL